MNPPGAAPAAPAGPACNPRAAPNRTVRTAAGKRRPRDTVASRHRLTPIKEARDHVVNPTWESFRWPVHGGRRHPPSTDTAGSIETDGEKIEQTVYRAHALPWRLCAYRYGDVRSRFPNHPGGKLG